MFSLLIFIFLTIFLVCKLNNILGIDIGFKVKKENIRSFSKEQKSDAEHAEITEMSAVESDLRKIDRNFDVEGFLQKSQQAFKIIFEAYANCDLDTLKDLLSEKMYSAFSMAIKDRKAKNQTLEGNFIRFISTNIISAEKNSSVDLVVVKFLTEQSNVLRDESGNAIEGSADFVRKHIDIWSFRKPAKKPIWLLSEIKSEEP